MKKDEGQGSLIFFESFMVGVIYRDTSDFFICILKEKKRGDKDYLSISLPI